MELSDALAIIEKIKSGEIILKLCSKENNVALRHLKLLDKHSASPSENISAILMDGVLGEKVLPVMMKLFKNSSNDPKKILYLEGLAYEMKVYEYITKNIIEKGHSPNFIPLIATASCPANSLLTGTAEKTIGSSSYAVILTEKAGNGAYFGHNSILPVSNLYTLYSELLRYSPECLDGIMFQIFFALGVMQKFRVVHNDLHANNILVMSAPKTTLGFIIGDSKYKVETHYIPYIFDWDNSYCEPLGENKKLNSKSWSRLGIYNKINSKGDLYTILCTLGGMAPKAAKRAGTYDINKSLIYSGVSQNPFLSLKEEQEGKLFPLSDLQLEKISKYQKLFSGKNKLPVYKFGRGQIEEIFGDEFKNPDYAGFDTLNTLMIEFVRHNGKMYFKMYNPYRCRITSIPDDFPTPLELIRDSMDKFLVDSLDGIPKKYIYTMPEAVPGRGFYVDPHYRLKGRKILEDEGVKPAFQKRAPGYKRVGRKKTEGDEEEKKED